MRNFFLILLFLPIGCFAVDTYGELKLGARKFTNTKLHKNYEDWEFSFGLEAGIIFCNCIGGALNYGFFHQDGHSFTDDCPSFLDLSHRTEIEMHNLDFLIKGYYPFSCWITLHGGIGPRLFFISIDNDSPYVQEHVQKCDIGGVVTGGIRMTWRCFYIDPFLEYGFVKMPFSNNQSSKRSSAHFDNLFCGVGIGSLF